MNLNNIATTFGAILQQNNALRQKKSGVAEKSRNYDKLCEKLNNATECQNASSVKK